MLDRLFRRLEQFGPLSDAERQALAEAIYGVREVPADRDLVRQGDCPTHSFVILEGFASRYKLLSDGRRQIISFEIAGDLCDPNCYFLGESDYSIGTLSPCKLASISHQAIGEITETFPRLTLLLWRHTMIDATFFYGWVSDGRQPSAYERIAHLLCETLLRLKAVGLAPEGSFELPLNQLKIADLLGLTPVHVNRTVKALREEGLVTMERETVTIRNWEALRNAGPSHSNYLYLNSRPDARATAGA